MIWLVLPHVDTNREVMGKTARRHSKEARLPPGYTRGGLGGRTCQALLFSGCENSFLEENATKVKSGGAPNIWSHSDES